MLSLDEANTLLGKRVKVNGLSAPFTLVTAQRMTVTSPFDGKTDDVFILTDENGETRTLGRMNLLEVVEDD